MSTRIELQPSYVLHTRPYRDTSLLVDVLTQSYGRVCLVVRGARKAKNSQRYLLQPLIPILLSWQGRSSLKTLTAIEAQDKSYGLEGLCLYSALYVNELLMYLLPQDDPAEMIYQYYQSLLSSLAETTTMVEPCLRIFELALLEALGYGIHFVDNSTGGQPLCADRNYFFILEHGFVDASHHSGVRYQPFSGRALLGIAQNDFSDPMTRQAAKILSRIALRPHLQGRKLKSRELFTSFVNSGDPKLK